MYINIISTQGRENKGMGETPMKEGLRLVCVTCYVCGERTEKRRKEHMSCPRAFINYPKHLRFGIY